MRTIKIYSMEDLLNNTELFNKAYDKNRLNSVQKDWFENHDFCQGFWYILQNFGETGSSIDRFENDFIGRFSAQSFNKVEQTNVLEILLKHDKGLVNVGKVELLLEESRFIKSLIERYKVLIEKFDNDIEFFWNGERFIGIESLNHKELFNSEQEKFVKIFKALNAVYVRMVNMAYTSETSTTKFVENYEYYEFFEDGTIYQ